MDTLTIWNASVPLADPANVAELLSGTYDKVPFAEFLAQDEPGVRSQYVFHEFGASYLMSDGDLATLFNVWPLTEAQARDIAAEFNLPVQWTVEAFHAMVYRVLGTLTRMQ